MAIANIVLADAQATPVNHTFVPLGPDADGVLWFEDPSTLSPIGNGRISIELKRPPNAVQSGQSSSQRTIRAKVGLHRPVLESLGNNSLGLTPSATVAYVPRVFAEFVMPERGTLQDRKDLRKMIYNLLNDTQVVSLIESLIKPF
jgi:hypothetical protein